MESGGAAGAAVRGGGGGGAGPGPQHGECGHGGARSAPHRGRRSGRCRAAAAAVRCPGRAVAAEAWPRGADEPPPHPLCVARGKRRARSRRLRFWGGRTRGRRHRTAGAEPVAAEVALPGTGGRGTGRGAGGRRSLTASPVAPRSVPRRRTGARPRPSMISTPEISMATTSLWRSTGRREGVSAARAWGRDGHGPGGEEKRGSKDLGGGGTGLKGPRRGAGR